MSVSGTKHSTPLHIRMFCLGSVLPAMLFFCITSLIVFISVLCLVLNSPPSRCTEACEMEESQASVVSLAPNLLLPLLAVITRHVPSAARYLIACMTWLWPLGILFLLPIAFVALLYFTAFMVQLYCLRDWLIGRSLPPCRRRLLNRHHSTKPLLPSSHCWYRCRVWRPGFFI